MGKGIIITQSGIEGISALEVRGILGRDSEINESYVTFDVDSFDDLCRLTYVSQSAERVLLLLGESSVDTLLTKSRQFFQDSNLKQFFSSETTFRSIVSHDDEIISSKELEKDLGSEVFKYVEDELEFKPGVDLNNPDIIIYCKIINNLAVLGIDFSGFDLNKREYRLFTLSKSLRSTLAYAAVRKANINKNSVVLDPFVGSGDIMIEAALFTSKFPIHFFSKDKLQCTGFIPNARKIFDDIDQKVVQSKGKLYCVDPKIPNINSTRKNAKIAGIHKTLELARNDLDFLDVKFQDKKFDVILTSPPDESKSVYGTLLTQSKELLNKSGNLTIVTKKPELVKDSSIQHKFRIIDELSVKIGDSTYQILSLRP